MKRISSKDKSKSISIIALFALLMQPITPVLAQGMAAAGGPIDIQADEQEFGNGHVVARGRVRVTYKDSVVLAPMATLYRDAAGSPQKAVFTGHPHLIQGSNKIDSDVLIFEIASQKIIADGHAHSEVLQNEPMGGPLAGGGASTETAPGATASPAKPPKVAKAPAKTAKPAMTKSGQINWPTKADDAAAATATAAKNAKDDMMADAATAPSDTPTTEQLMAPPPQAPASASSTVAKKTTPNKAPEKIITDSRYQEYERNTGRFEARGDVHVKHGDISVISDRLQLVYGADAKPETALFTGHVSATQNENNTQADIMTYFLSTQRLQATGNVRSKVIQKKAEGPKKGGPDEGSQAADSTNVAQTPDKTKLADSTKPGFTFDMDGSKGETMYIDSDAQDYSKDSGRMAAQGNVRVKYGDTTGIGPNVVLIRNGDGQAEKVVFTGRSQISQPGKRWIGDKITMMVNDRKVLAEGNTRAIILQTPGKTGGTANIPGSFGATKRAPIKLPSTMPNPSDSAGTLAGVKNQVSAVSANSNSKLSLTKIEGTE